MRLLTAALPSSYVVTEMLMAYSSTAHTQIYPHRGKQTLRFVLIDLKLGDTEVWISVLCFVDFFLQSTHTVKQLWSMKVATIS